MKIVLALSVLAVAAAAPQGYGAPPQGYGAPVGGAAASQLPVYGASQGSAGAQSQDAQARTISEENINNGDGTYRFSFETDNGILREEEGDGTQVRGSYSYTADDGTPVEITFVADENGFQPEGDALPTPVPTEYPTPEVPATEAAAGSYSAPAAAAASYSAPAAAAASYSAPSAAAASYSAPSAAVASYSAPSRSYGGAF
ncbi:pupal cuticle protein 20-like [Amphibalanus amphitrite]|uniref:pupal cuticle protein 20-like n=1 Tax=Amphibalanus amphitrite TaxID=1232801 RepID=UPI001C900E20|nr:pupal cuticle protein 20-like [Amphibalanus amphitrite]